MMFSVKTTSYNNSAMLNICDADILGRQVTDGSISISIKPSYYGERLVDEEEAKTLLRGSDIINMAGERIVAISTGLGLGSLAGVRKISDVPFLIVFRM